MEEMTAFCGLACHLCEARLATENDDDRKRAEVAALWSKLYKTDIKAEDIHCYGCLSRGKQIFNYCKVCEIRACGRERNLPNCAYCTDYPCKKLDFIFKVAPEARRRLDGIRLKDRA